jgi:hypothetical protein
VVTRLEPHGIFDSENYSTLISLILFAIAGGALFVFFVITSMQSRRTRLPESTALDAVSQIVTLETSTFVEPARLLDDTEYQILCSNPDLHHVAKRFRRERQELAILWVDSLKGDVMRLRRFRQFLVRQGADTALGEELRMMQAFVGAILILNCVDVSIRLVGPFAFARMTRRANRAVEKMSYVTASALCRIPAAGWPEIERNWAKVAA